MPHKNDIAWLLAQYWPGLAAAVALLGWLSAQGFIDGVAHLSAVERLKLQFEAYTLRNEDAHKHMTEDISEIKAGVNKLIDAQMKR